MTCYNKRFLEEIGKATTYKRSNIVMFYHRLQRRFPDLNLKNLPICLGVYSFTMQREILNIKDVKDHIIKLWKKDKCLATDVMFCLNLGLRRSELQKVFLQDKNGYFYRMIKVF
jgi:hypothetical protein